MKYQRVYKVEKYSIMLLGPRGTGKSTFIKNELKPDLVIDLLKQENLRKLSLNPSKLVEFVAHLKKGQTVLIDEIQKVPELLDEVHRLIEELGLVFFLTGSSARKLKTSGANLLAGRATSRKMYPLSLKEIGRSRTISSLLFSGQLPRPVTESQENLINDFLFSYVETYLKEEIFQEGIVRNLNDFSKFVEVAGQYHGQILNYESLAREVGKSGDTIKSWFQIFTDTLVGSLIEAYPIKMAPRESKHPKFYFFDCGVARAAQGMSKLEDIPEQRGYYFETIILNEIKTYIEVTQKRFKVFYYSISSTGDVDFIVETKRKTLSQPSEFVGIEIKLSKVWKPEFENLLSKIKEARPKQLKKCIGIYQGDQRLTRGTFEVFPVAQFVEMLWSGKLF